MPTVLNGEEDFALDNYPNTTELFNQCWHFQIFRLESICYYFKTSAPGLNETSHIESIGYKPVPRLGIVRLEKSLRCIPFRESARIPESYTVIKDTHLAVGTIIIFMDNGVI